MKTRRQSNEIISVQVYYEDFLGKVRTNINSISLHFSNERIEKVSQETGLSSGINILIFGCILYFL